MRHFLEPLLEARQGVAALANARTGETIATCVIAAFDSKTRNRGLLGLNGLPAGAALVLAPCQAIHTWFMKFPIDVVFVRSDGRVSSIRHRVDPWRIAIDLRAFAVIELPAGTLSGRSIVPTDVVSVVESP